MASAESSASLNAPDLGVAAVKTKKPRKSSAPKRTAAGGKRVTAPKPGAWLERAEADQLKKCEQKESAAYAALKNKKPCLIRGVAPSKFGDGKFQVWIEGRGAAGTFDPKDALNLSASVCKDHKALLDSLSCYEWIHPEQCTKHAIRMLESKVFGDKTDSSVAWKSVTKVVIEVVQQAEPEDVEMTEEGEEDSE